MTEPFLPLQGYRVVEMTHMIMGPSCGMFLALMGAEVIKIEPPAGDKTRNLTGMGSPFFPLFNRGKKSVQLDLSGDCLLYTSPSPRDGLLSRMPSSA